jgi:Ca2+-binding RTX toxin-like protein
VTARIGGASTGVGGEADELRASVENLTGGGAADALFGTGGPNRLIGNGGSDELTGFAGADVLAGGAGLDTLDAGGDADSISGGADADTVRARDGIFDTISCGDGNDTVIADLADFFSDPVGLVRNRNGRDCESLDVFAVDDGPPGHALGRRLAVARGTADVTVACPRNARVRCRGTLTARLGGIDGRVLARRGYTVRLGGRATVSVRVGNRGRGTRIVLETTEQGVSKKGPRSATRLVVVR